MLPSCSFGWSVTSIGSQPVSVSVSSPDAAPPAGTAPAAPSARCGRCRGGPGSRTGREAGRSGTARERHKGRLTTGDARLCPGPSARRPAARRSRSSARPRGPPGPPHLVQEKTAQEDRRDDQEEDPAERRLEPGQQEADAGDAEPELVAVAGGGDPPAVAGGLASPLVMKERPPGPLSTATTRCVISWVASDGFWKVMMSPTFTSLAATGRSTITEPVWIVGSIEPE